MSRLMSEVTMIEENRHLVESLHPNYRRAFLDLDREPLELEKLTCKGHRIRYFYTLIPGNVKCPLYSVFQDNDMVILQAIKAQIECLNIIF